MQNPFCTKSRRGRCARDDASQFAGCGRSHGDFLAAAGARARLGFTAPPHYSTAPHCCPARTVPLCMGGKGDGKQRRQGSPAGGRHLRPCHAAPSSHIVSTGAVSSTCRRNSSPTTKPSRGVASSGAAHRAPILSQKEKNNTREGMVRTRMWAASTLARCRCSSSTATTSSTPGRASKRFVKGDLQSAPMLRRRGKLCGEAVQCDGGL